MKMNATKLTIALVALLLALTCVFAACGKKNNTDKPDDTTPVDNTPAPVDTVAKEDLLKIAEDLKADFAKYYVDLYSPETETAIAAEKSNALFKINNASSAKEAQDVADAFISYLKSQKTIVDSIAALVEKIGDVSLKDVDALNELADVVAKLDAAYAGGNTAKQTALDAYKADTATQKTIKAIVDRYAQLKSAKKDADVLKGGVKADGSVAVEDGVNAQIAALKADFSKEGKELTLVDFNTYTALIEKEIAPVAEKYNLVAGTDAYADVFDLTTLDAAKKLLDAAFKQDAVLAKMLEVVEQAKTLEDAADAALWREYVYIPASAVRTVKDTTYNNEVTFADGTKGYTAQAYVLSYDKDTTYTNSFVFEDGGEYFMKAADDKTGTYGASGFVAAKFFATEKAAAAQGIEKTVKIEVTLVPDVYKLSLKATVEAAKKVRDDLKDYTADALAKYHYGEPGDAVAKAAGDIDTIYAAYDASVKRAYNTYKVTLKSAALNDKTDLDINGDDAKKSTLGTYSLQAEFDLAKTKLGNDASKNQDNIAKAITAAVNTFIAKSETGTFYDGGKFYTNSGDYYSATTTTTDPVTSATITIGDKAFDLVSGVPTISYEAWTYRYQLKTADDVKDTEALYAFGLLQAGEPLTKDVDGDGVYDVADGDTFTDDNGNGIYDGIYTADLAKAAVRWLKMYIGEGEYAETYNLYEYKDYATGLTKTDIIYMTDRAITEVAVPGVVQIRGNDVNVAKDETAVAANLLSPYTVAKALIAEQDKIDAAKEEAFEAIKAAALALKAAGNANAVQDAKDTMAAMLDGSYLNEKLYEDTSKNAYLKVAIINTEKVVLAEKPEKVESTVKDLINKAVAAKDDAETALKEIEKKHKTGDSEFVTLKDLLDLYKDGKTISVLDDEAAATAQDNVTTSIITINEALKKNSDAAELFASYVAEAKRQYEVAAAGETAKVIGSESNAVVTSGGGYDKMGNMLKARAEENQKLIQGISYIFQDYGNFKQVYDKVETKAQNAANLKISATASDFSGFLANYKTISDAKHDKVTGRIAEIANANVAPSSGTAYSKQDNKFLTEALKKLNDQFTEAFAAYKGISAVVVTDTLANDGVPAPNTGYYALLAKNAIDAFSEEAADADYINLKVAYSFGEEKVEYDLLTETYRALTMKKAYDKIEKILAKAGKPENNYYEAFTDTNDNGVCDGTETFTDSTSGDLANGTWDSALALLTVKDGWKDAATKRVNKLAVNFEAVTSLKKAEADLDSYAANETVYDLSGVVDILTKFDSSVTVKSFKQDIK